MSSPSHQSHLSYQIKEESLRLGFDLCRIAAVTEAPHGDFFEGWVGMDRAGEMHYLSRNIDKRRNPALLADGQTGHPTDGPFHSIIVLAVNHYQHSLAPSIIADPSRGIIASYAWGDDYHEIIRPALYELDGFIRHKTGRATQGKCLVDTGPVLERDWAHQAGVGFTGKNCCTINPQIGSWLLLATILVPEKLATDPLPTQLPATKPAQHKSPSLVTSQAILDGVPPTEEYGRWEMPLSPPLGEPATDERHLATCGRCTRCIDDCPTDAFVGPYHLNPQRCISYWTIESRTAIPRELRSYFGNRIFGCDICQEVCPWNQRLEEHSPLMVGLTAQGDRIAPYLLEGFAQETPYWLNQEAFSLRFRRSPIKRAKRVGMLRNVCVALGNWGDIEVVEALDLALQDEDPLPRGHAAWALGKILAAHNHEPCKVLLEAALQKEDAEWVREEMRLALGQAIKV